MSRGYFVDAIMTYVELLDPTISLIGADDVPHIYFARSTVEKLGVLGVSELIAKTLYGDD